MTDYESTFDYQEAEAVGRAKAAKKLTKAIDRYTGIAPAFAQQVAEMLITYYGYNAANNEDD